jgi:hypothetical protein
MMAGTAAEDMGLYSGSETTMSSSSSAGRSVRMSLSFDVSRGESDMEKSEVPTESSYSSATSIPAKACGIGGDGSCVVTLASSRSRSTATTRATTTAESDIGVTWKESQMDELAAKAIELQSEVETSVHVDHSSASHEIRRQRKTKRKREQESMQNPALTYCSMVRHPDTYYSYIRFSFILSIVSSLMTFLTASLQLTRTSFYHNYHALYISFYSTDST